MCVIIDANAAHLLVKGDKDALPVINWIVAGKGFVAIGGRNKVELEKSNSFKALLRQFILAARVKQYADKDVNAQEAVLDHAAMKSNDPHVLALARVSGSRLLYSDDHALHHDFKCGKHFPQPKGKVYQKASHKHLLAKCPECR